MAHASSLLILSALVLGACASASTSAPAPTTATAPAGSTTRGDMIPEGAAAGGSTDLGREGSGNRDTSLNTDTQSGTRGGPVTPDQ